MATQPTFDEYKDSLGRLTAHVDPVAVTPEGILIREAATSLALLPEVTIQSLVDWVMKHPRSVTTLGLVVGLSQEKLKRTLAHHLKTEGWITLARTRPLELIQMLDREYDLVRQVEAQRTQKYDFGDILVARAGTRAFAARAGVSGRHVEDEIEAVVRSLGVPCEARTRFTGRSGRTAPCDLAIPNAADAAIVVADKGFDSTGSKLTDAVREVEEMADVRLPRQFTYAVIDGIGWLGRIADLRRIYDLWTQQQINGMYTLASLDRFRHDVEEAARILRLL
jgi:hypothetical protein